MGPNGFQKKIKRKKEEKRRKKDVALSHLSGSKQASIA